MQDHFYADCAYLSPSYAFEFNGKAYVKDTA